MKTKQITLSDVERRALQKLLRQGKLSAKTYKRALALLELDRGGRLTAVAKIVGVVYQTVCNWANRYRATGLAFLTDKPRPGRPQVIDGLQKAKITALACSEPPVGYARWSLRLLADKAVELAFVESVSYGEVRRILKKTN